MATKKLQHYFTNREVTVVTSFPLGEVIHSLNTMGCISKWELELMGYDIKYAPALPSNRRPWLTLLPSGPRSKPRLRTSPTSTRPYTSTGRSWDPTRGPA
jgi:hypothetical protein